MAPESGIRSVAESLLERGHWHDATDCLFRAVPVQPAHSGGSRDWDMHYESIEVDPACLPFGKDVLLLDDVTTTSTSLKVCRELLRQYDVVNVKMMALGKTVGY